MKNLKSLLLVLGIMVMPFQIKSASLTLTKVINNTPSPEQQQDPYLEMTQFFYNVYANGKLLSASNPAIPNVASYFSGITADIAGLLADPGTYTLDKLIYPNSPYSISINLRDSSGSLKYPVIILVPKNYTTFCSDVIVIGIDDENFITATAYRIKQTVGTQQCCCTDQYCTIECSGDTKIATTELFIGNSGNFSLTIGRVPVVDDTGKTVNDDAGNPITKLNLTLTSP